MATLKLITFFRWIFHHEDNKHDRYENNQRDNAFHRKSILLMILCFLQLLDTFLSMLDCALHIIVDAVKDGPLINDEDSELLKYLS